MEDKNLNDIVIDDGAENPKKAQFKNIMTLLGLLLAILFISIVITRLILGDSDKPKEGDPTAMGAVQPLGATGTVADANSSMNGNITAGGAILPPVTTPIIKERNITSHEKISLRDHTSVATARETGDNDGSVRNAVAQTPASRPATTSRAVVRDETDDNDRVIRNRGGSDTTVHHAPAKTVTVAKKPVSHYVIPKGFYLKVGSFENVSPDFLKKIVAKGFDYKLSKTPSTEANSTTALTRVLVGPYYSEKGAKDVLSKVQELSPNAYIIKM
ncbi:MAG: hypothetical protein KN64_10880 [Sulfurovum sp. AS07-7]|nr:MAG: hypothetical protein KN64_10880 [Sulfurovum sp. AS07-7]